jgi:glycine/D-amino acid oxidase-like deaminating enzyme
MLNLADRVACDTTLPDEVDVVVIGAGIIGAAAAYYLSRSGKKVALLEKGLVAAEQSSRNWGWCRQVGRSLPEVPLAMHSLRLWDKLDGELQRPTGFRRPGVLLVTKTPFEVEGWESWLAQTRPFDMQARVLTAQEVRSKTPGSTANYIAGFYSPLDGLAEPTMAAPALVDAARALGAVVIEQCAARGMETSNGRVTALITERGTVKTGAVLCAGGAWSAMFCAHHGIALPQAGVFASACRTTAISGLIDGTGAVGSDDFSFRGRRDGGVTLAMRGAGRVELTPQGLRHARAFFPLFLKRRKSLKLGIGKSMFDGPESMRGWKNDQITPFERMRVLDPAPDMALLQRAFSQMQQAYPAMQKARIEQAWGGLIDSTPDSVPIISAIDALPGFFVATGFSGHGFAIGPASGHLAAEIVLGKKTTVDATPFRYARFAERSTHATSRWI